MNQPHKVILAGCGKMGGALLRGWISAALQIRLSVIEPHDITIPNVTHFRTIEDASTALRDADTVILAVKPQVMADVCARIAPLTRRETLFLSIAAGQSLSTLEKHLGENRPIIRAMPNTPAAIGKGMTACVANAQVTADQKKLAAQLLETAGRVEWLDHESLMDAVTALSGSGPAYLFYLMEVMAESGRKIGLPENLATILARQTVIGAAALAETDPDTAAATLRQNVTSPGGTTEAALKILMDGRMQSLFDDALRAARDRGRELGN